VLRVIEMPVGVTIKPGTQSSACGQALLRFGVQSYHGDVPRGVGHGPDDLPMSWRI